MKINFKKSEFDNNQMEQIRLGLKQNLDIFKYEDVVEEFKIVYNEDNNKKAMKLKQIVTGTYSFPESENLPSKISHCLYGLDEDGKVWKYIVKECKWVKLEDLKPKK